MTPGPCARRRQARASAHARHPIEITMTGTWCVSCTSARMTTTPWGSASVIEEVSVRQGAGEKEFTTTVQLLERDDGESLVRFAYSSGGAVRRGPVTLRPADLHRLRKALVKAPRLRAALDWR